MKKFLVFPVLLLAGCISTTNPSPTIITPEEASFDNGIQNSGILYASSNDDFVIISQDALNRYNNLIEKYGSILPKEEAKANFGISGPVYIMTVEALDNWCNLNLKHKNPDIVQKAN
jgi:hypothetical protein